jgi:hypothetical protein
MPSSQQTIISPDCPHGHGALNPTRPVFGVPELVDPATTPHPQPGMHQPTGRYMVLKAFECPVCHYVEFYAGAAISAVPSP